MRRLNRHDVASSADIEGRPILSLAGFGARGWGGFGAGARDVACQLLQGFAEAGNGMMHLLDAAERTFPAPQSPVERGHGLGEARIVVLEPHPEHRCVGEAEAGYAESSRRAFG